MRKATGVQMQNTELRTRKRNVCRQDKTECIVKKYSVRAKEQIHLEL